MEPVLRSATVDDVAAIAALIRRAEAHDGVPRVLSDEELAADLAAPFVDLTADTRVALVDGEVVGWALAWHQPAGERLERADLVGEVDPGFRGRGLGRQLLAWTLDRVREQLAAHDHDLPRHLRGGAYDWQEDRARLFARFGLVPTRWADELLLPLDGPRPEVADPDGVRIVAWTEDRDADALDLRNASFADHWGSTYIHADLWADLVRGPCSRPDLSLLAVDDTGELLGFCLCHVYPEDEALTGRRDAWIEILGTRADARGRGIASALIARSVTAYADAGFTHAVIEVDADNPTGAARLYHSLGFRPHLRSVTHLLELAPDGTTLAPQSE